MPCSATICYMPHIRMQGPPGYQELCAKLQGERNPAKFRLLVEKINCLLREYEGTPTLGSAVQSASHELSLEVLVSASS